MKCKNTVNTEFRNWNKVIVDAEDFNNNCYPPKESIKIKQFDPKTGMDKFILHYHKQKCTEKNKYINITETPINFTSQERETKFLHGLHLQSNFQGNCPSQNN